MQKALLRDAIVAQLHRELEVQTRAALDSRDEATSSENKQEGKYDMRAQEAAYLAEAQARLAAEIGESVTLYQSMDLPVFPAGSPAAVGALITLQGPKGRTCYFLGPRHGGLETQFEKVTVTVITPSSPLGRQLLGRRHGDTVQLPGRGAPVAHRIVAID